MSNETITNNSEKSEVEQSTKQEVNTFTQEQVNSIVQKRLKDKELEIKEAQAKTTELDNLKVKAEQYDKLQVELKEATLRNKIISLGVNPNLIEKAMKLIDTSKDITTQVNEEILTIQGFSNIPETSNVNHLGVKGVMKQEKQNEKITKSNIPSFGLKN